MRLELEPIPSPLPFTESPNFEKTEENRTTEAGTYLREGIKAAQAGNRVGARAALLRAAELDPRSESAWLWLSSISEYPEELFVFLTNVLDINPENARALEWAAATKSLLAKNFVQRGIDAAEANQSDAAVQYFNQALEYDEQNSMAWLWLASLADSSEGKMSYLEKVLELDPENEAAGAAYKTARDSIRENLLSEARRAAVAGKNSEAEELLNAILAEDPDAEDAWVLKAHLTNGFEEKIEAFTRILDINPANATAKASLESLKSIFAAVTPEIGEEAIELSNDEPLATSETGIVVDAEGSTAEFHEESLPVTGSIEPGPESVLDESSFVNALNSEEISFDEKGCINYSDEFSSENVIELSSIIHVDTDAETQPDFEPECGRDLSAAVEMPTGSELFVQENIDVQTIESEVEPEPQECEEITYELSTEADNELEEALKDEEDHTQLTESVEQCMADEFAATEARPFADVDSSGLADEYPTVSSFNIDQEILKFMPTVESDATANINGLSESSFGQTMFGTNIKPPQPTEALDAPFDMTMFGSKIPMPESELNQPAIDLPTGFETRIVRDVEEIRSTPSKLSCVFCDFENEAQAVSCQGCLSVLTLADLEMLLANHHAEKSVLRHAVQRMEDERASRAFDETELTMLGIGHLNLRNLLHGYNYLLEASQLNPNNVILSSQVNALLIRLEEIKQQEEVHESMTSGKTILVVDDSATVRKLIAGKLEKCGHDVFCSNDGVEAMERLEELRPDLILLDINMPRMDGYQVCKLIRSNTATKDVPVVMISGKDGFFDKVRGRMAGTSGYITKPFGPETLMKAVESYLKGEMNA